MKKPIQNFVPILALTAALYAAGCAGNGGAGRGTTGVFGGADTRADGFVSIQIPSSGMGSATLTDATGIYTGPVSIASDGTVSGTLSTSAGGTVSIIGTTAGSGSGATVNGSISGDITSTFTGSYVGSGTPNSFSGVFHGTFSGGNSGTFSMRIGNTGFVSGTLTSISGSGSLSGKISSTGNLESVRCSNGMVLTGSFVNDAGTKSGAGLWTKSSTSSSGSWAASPAP